MTTELICEECKQEVTEVCTAGHYQGLCFNCEQEVRRENECFNRDHIYVFGSEYDY